MPRFSRTCAGSVPGCCEGWGCRAEPCLLLPIPPHLPLWLQVRCDATCVHHDCPHEQQPKEGLHFVGCSVPCPRAKRAGISGAMGTLRTLRSPLASLPWGLSVSERAVVYFKMEIICCRGAAVEESTSPALPPCQCILAQGGRGIRKRPSRGHSRPLNPSNSSSRGRWRNVAVRQRDMQCRRLPPSRPLPVGFGEGWESDPVGERPRRRWGEALPGPQPLLKC